MDSVLGIIKDSNLEFFEKRNALAKLSEKMIIKPNIGEKAQKFINEGIIFDMFEGNTPYRPRYILPDYNKYIKRGSKYLSIKPPKDIYEAINSLLIIYRYVPSITGYPVYLGQIDEILEPFAKNISKNELKGLLKMFLINIDRTMPDSFVHFNIGPTKTLVGEMILDLEKDLKHAVPNISLKINKDTPKEFIINAIKTALCVGKPYFVNESEIESILGKDFGVASCYNTLKIGGGSHTLVRLNLKLLAKSSKNLEDFLDFELPKAVELMCEVINVKAKFIVEEAKFFESSFLAKEGIIELDKFTSMFGIIGLHECVEILTKGLNLGKDKKALEISQIILKKLCELIKSHEGTYCGGFNGKIGFHAQTGIETDIDVTAGVRIKIGEEPDIITQIKTEALLQKYFDTGVSDIYNFESTAKSNPEAIFKLIEGAFKNGMKIMAINTSDSELIRISGYLVKRSDVESYFKGEKLREDTVALAGESIKNNKIFKRKVFSIK